MPFKYTLENYHKKEEKPKKSPHKEDRSKDGVKYRNEFVQAGILAKVDDKKHIWVRNVEDTSKEESEFEHEWAGYWQDKTHLKFPSVCSNCNCGNDEEHPEIVGAHVRIEGEQTEGKGAWIAPLCKSCNSATNKGKMKLSTGTWLAHVTMSKSHKTASEQKPLSSNNKDRN